MATTWTPDATDLYYADVYNQERVNNEVTGFDIYAAQVADKFDFNKAYLEEAANLLKNNGLSAEQNANVKAVYSSAKYSGNEKLGKVMDFVFKYGKSALEILVGLNIIKTGSTQKAITPDSVDTEAFDNYVQSAKTKVVNQEKVPVSTPTNSTYFGIDFSSPIVWIIIVAIVILIFSLKSSSPQAVYLPQQTAKR